MSRISDSNGREAAARARRDAMRLAAEQDGVISWQDARELGVPRRTINGLARSGHWRVEQRSIVPEGSVVPEKGLWRIALNASSPRAMLDGSSALRRVGLVGYDDGIHLSMPRGARAVDMPGVRVHELRSWSADDMVEGPLRHARRDVAGLRGALWAPSDRAAVTFLAMSVQQHIVPADRLMARLWILPRNRRAPLIRATVSELVGGAESLHEIDVASECRRRGLPRPSRQRIVRRPGGVWYLDVHWEGFDLTVEIDGVHHLRPDQIFADSLKQNAVTLGGGRVLRFPTVAVRTDPEPFYAQIEQALVLGGWSRFRGHPRRRRAG